VSLFGVGQTWTWRGEVHGQYRVAVAMGDGRVKAIQRYPFALSLPSYLAQLMVCSPRILERIFLSVILIYKSEMRL
jgi:hypothetical protein